MAGRFDQFIGETVVQTTRKKKKQDPVKTAGEKSTLGVSLSRPMRASEATYELATLIKLSTGASYQQILEHAMRRQIQALVLTDSK